MTLGSKQALVALMCSFAFSSPLWTFPLRAQENPYFRLDLAPDQKVHSFLNVTTDALLGSFVDQEGPTPGATLRPVDPVLRSQLGIPAGEGLLVYALSNPSPSAQAGLKQNDILLSLGGKPLATAQDVTERLKAAGEAPVPLRVIRNGKVIALPVRPIYRVALGPVQEQKTEYYLGISLKPVDDALRAQLQLPPGEGVVVTSVVEGSPAAKAGIEKHDIVLKLGGKSIDSHEALERQVQATRNKSTDLELRHRGSPRTVQITPAARQLEATRSDGTTLFWFAEQPRLSNVLLDGRDLADSTSRIEELEKQVKSLREALDKAMEQLKANEGKKR
jgi:C-terminal processing protease CtpA/Prc